MPIRRTDYFQSAASGMVDIYNMLGQNEEAALGIVAS